ncbi:MAG: hypothetical protein HY683_08250 [Chloroflexi bacterium]|nr:hypothetical protein [Chloroflexota bacterium]
MWSGTAVTKCRLCGEDFEEQICTENGSAFWKPTDGHPLEDGAPWCPVCKEHIDEVCEVLLDKLDVSLLPQE